METKKTRHLPRGLFNIFFANAFFMVSLVCFNALLVLYVTHHFHFSDKKAYELYAAFISLFYSASLIGGYLGSRYSHKNAVLIGGITATLGIFLTTIPSINLLYLGLAFYIIGSGCLVPNVFCALGQLYKKNDGRRDTGFTIAYIGTNVGAFIAGVSSGYIARYYNTPTVFAIAAVCMIIALIIFFAGFNRYKFQPNSAYLLQKNNRQITPIITTIIVAIIILNLLLEHQKLSNIILIIAGSLAYITTFFISFREPKKARFKMFAFLFLILISITFWSLYALAPSALTIFIERNVNRLVFGHIIPTASFYGLNPFFIITVGVFTSILWLKISKSGRIVTPAAKFAVGTLLMGLGYIILLPAIQHANILGFVGVGWIVLSYFLQTTGELFVGPIGYSMVGSLVPARMEGTMMGLFQLSTGMAGAISGFLAQATSSAKIALDPMQTDPIYKHAFFLYGSVTAAAAIFLIVLLPFINRLIRAK